MVVEKRMVVNRLRRSRQWSSISCGDVGGWCNLDGSRVGRRSRSRSQISLLVLSRLHRGRRVWDLGWGGCRRRVARGKGERGGLVGACGAPLVGRKLWVLASAL